MMTYWIINVPFLLAAALVISASWALRRSPRGVPWLVAAAVMMTLTAVFDNAIIGFGLVDYDPSLISGLRIGFAPVEDFAYTVAALLIVPALWHMMEPRVRKAHS
jgi:lycopene cyclase domain-containing protein